MKDSPQQPILASKMINLKKKIKLFQPLYLTNALILKEMKIFAL